MSQTLVLVGAEQFVKLMMDFRRMLTQKLKLSKLLGDEKQSK